MFLIALVVAVAYAIVFGSTALAGAAKLRTGVEADLSGAAVVPPGTGRVQMGLYPVKNNICYSYHVDLHTSDHPDGAVRGQLSLSG